VRHAGQEALNRLDAVLGELRRIEGMVEKRPGVFYRGPKAFLHFHEDPSGIYVDVRLRSEFERLRVETKAERASFIKQVRLCLAGA
jgi:hypothetical protein